MADLEYKTIPAPTTARKVRGVKRADERMALTLTDVLNAQSAEGWEFIGSETIVTEQKSGMLSRKELRETSFLVFCRETRKPAPAGRVEPQVEEPAASEPTDRLGPAT
ncbi:MAG: hypothetical protein ACPGID_08550 [Rubricella sp.]